MNSVAGAYVPFYMIAIYRISRVICNVIQPANLMEQCGGVITHFDIISEFYECSKHVRCILAFELNDRNE